MAQRNYLGKLERKYGHWITDLGQGESAKKFLILQQMLSDGVDPDTIGGYKETALLRTQGSGLKVPLLLLRHGANPNYRCQQWEGYGGTILHIAAKKGNLPLVKLLLAAGADTEAVDKSNRTAEDVAEGNCKPYIRFARTQRGVDFKSGTLEDAMALFTTNRALVLTMKIGLDATSDADEALVSLTNMAGEEVETLKVKLKLSLVQMKAVISEQFMVPVKDLALVLANGSLLETSSAGTVKELFSHVKEHSLAQEQEQMRMAGKRKADDIQA